MAISHDQPNGAASAREKSGHSLMPKRKASQEHGSASPTKRTRTSTTPEPTPAEKLKIVPFPEKVKLPCLNCYGPQLTQSKPAVIEERDGEIEFRVVNNDGSRESTMILTGLKCIFQKQLPKMPKDYIARLVYDRTHLSMAIVKHPLEVVG